MISIHKANFLNNAPSIPGRSPFGSVPLQRPRGPDVVRVAVGPKTGEALAAISFEDLRLTKDRRVIVKSPLDPVVEPPNLETYGLVAERVVEKKKGCFDPWDFQRNEPKEVVLKWVTEESKKEGEINLSKLLVFIAVKNAVQNAATEKAKQKLLESDGFILEQLEEATTRSLHEAQPASRVVLPGVSVREPDPERIHQKATVVVEGKGKSKMYPEDEDKGHNDEIVPSLEHRKQPFVPWEYNDEQPPKRQRVDSGPGYFASQAPISHTSFQPDLPQLDLSNRQVPPMSDHFSGLIGTSWLHDIGAELLLGSNGVDQVGPTRPSVVPVASVGKGIPTGPSNALASVAGGSTGQAPKDQDQVIVEDEEAPLKTAEKDANVQQSKTDVGEPDSMTFLWETLHTPFPQHTVAENSANWLDYLFHMNNAPSIPGRSLFGSIHLQRPRGPNVVRVAVGPRSGDANGTVLTTEEGAVAAPSPSASVIDINEKSTVTGGGVEDVYGEDTATEDQVVTPWAISVASGYSLLRDPRHNKGLAFTDKERDGHYLQGLLPPAIVPQQLQVKKMIHHIRQYQVPLQKYMAMMDLQERNESLFYRLLIDNVEELLPVVYTPTVGEACQKYGSIFRQPQGLFISLKDKGRVLEVLKNWPERHIQVIVLTDGERILGLGDLGCQGMGIPVGKLSLYAALGGICPSACLPVTIDVGTNNDALLNDEFYIGLRQKRATGQEYAELIDEFMTAVKKIYGEKVLVQFEDFANHNAFDLLAKYGSTHLVFNDDIQGTASVVLSGLLAAQKLVGKTLADQTYLFLGAGEAGTGIAELIALEISKQTNISLEQAREKIWLLDSKGLIVNGRKESLQQFKKPWAHEHEPVKGLLNAVKALKPNVLIGSSGVGRTFTKDVVEAMATFNERPIILALSNPTSQSECTAEEAYTWSKGRAIFASGSPFDPVEYEGRTYTSGQSNNAYIFPGFGLGLIISGAIRVHDDMLLAASEALASQVTEEHFAKGLLYPPFKNIRKISAHIAASVAAKAYELGLATQLPQPENLMKYAESCMYSPAYKSYR